MGLRRRTMLIVLFLSIAGILSGFIGSAFVLIAGVSTALFITFLIVFVAMDIWK